VTKKSNNSPVKPYKHIVMDSGDPGYVNRIMVGTAVTGSVRIEWHSALVGAIIPANWSHVSMQQRYYMHPPTFYPLRWQVDDAQNLIVREVLNGEFEWVFLLEHDVVIPNWMFLLLNEYIMAEQVPIVSGLYFTRTHPSEPLVYRGRGVGAYYGESKDEPWQIGDKLYVDGVPTGCLLVHTSILREMWNEADEYIIPNSDNVKTRKVFKTPRYMFKDPQTGWLNTSVGTSDLDWCTRIMQGDILRRAGWGAYVDGLEDEKYPFLIDTRLMCGHIDNMTGAMYPPNVGELMGAANELVAASLMIPRVSTNGDYVESRASETITK
jgi:hypothetical protein